MRQAGTFAFESDARRLSDYLLTQGIPSRVEPTADRWALWIIDEKNLERSKRELAEYVERPDDPRYQQSAATAEAVRRQLATEAKRARERTVELRDRWQAGPGANRLTLLLTMCSILVAISTDWGKNAHGEFGQKLFIASANPELRNLFDPTLSEPSTAVWRAPDFGLTEIAHGEIWRLVTPIFLHFGIPHLLFNMLALTQLGGAVETRQGAWRLALIVLVSAVVPNLAQYFWSGPMFGGMSGVCFALFGYIWMQSRFVPAAGLFMPRQMVFLSVVWLIACSVQDAGVANMVHFAGVATGAAMGVAPLFLRR